MASFQISTFDSDSSNLYIIDILYKNNDELYKYINGYDFHLFIFKLILSISSIQNIEVFKTYILKINHIYHNNIHQQSEFTLYDIYIYLSHIMENYIVSYVLFNLIMNNNCNIENNTVNVQKLRKFGNLLNINHMYSERFNYIDDIKKYGYVNKFLYFVNFACIKLKHNKNYVKNHSNNHELFSQNFDKLYINHINALYSLLNNNNISFYDNSIDGDNRYVDMMYLADHMIGISNNDLYEIVAKNICMNSDVSEIENINNVYTMLRFIYSKNLESVKIYETRYNTPLKDTFYVFNKKTNTEFLISSQKYLNDILVFMSNINVNIQKYMYDTIYKYVNDTYVTKKNNCTNKDCSICLDQINSDDFSYCNYCNNYYHSNCFEQLLTNHTKCALCRQDLYPNSISHCNFKYNLFKGILDNISLI